MDAALVAAGVALVLVIGWDIAVTLLHPGARGQISYAANRSAWSAIRGVSGNVRVLSYAGPVAMFANMAAWLLGLWLGHALIFMSGLDVGDALYRSGEALTTVGFGISEFDPERLRYVAVFEAAAGLGAFTAVIAYVLSVYPLLTEVRASALVAGLTVDAGTTDVPALTRDLIEVHEHVKRFPVLYYFESGDEGESIATLLKAASIACLRLREGGDDRDAAPLERALTRLFDDLERDFIGGRSARRTESDGDTDFATRADRVIGAFAEEHRQEHTGLAAATRS